MPAKNRINPWGEPIQTTERGYFMGNRQSSTAWITCSLRHPDGKTGPSHVTYEKLFFLDEPTALAAGYRPCSECRRQDYELFKRLLGANSYKEMDSILQRERQGAESATQRTVRRADQLPAGAMGEIESGIAVLIWQRVAYLWTPGGYARRDLTKNIGRVRVLTPPSMLKVLEAGYRPWVHPTVMRAI